MESLGTGVRNGILNLTLRDQVDLYACYMPFINNGGLFIPTRRFYVLGDEVFLLLDLMGEPEKIPLTGKVVWVSPKGLGGNRRQGVGIQLDDSHSQLIGKIETYLAGMLTAKTPTYTM